MSIPDLRGSTEKIRYITSGPRSQLVVGYDLQILVGEIIIYRHSQCHLRVLISVVRHHRSSSVRPPWRRPTGKKA